MKPEAWMQKAIELSKNSDPKEVPIAAIIVQDKQMIASALNTKEVDMNPCGHAEINAIQAAAKKLKSWRLEGCDLYVTLEPCLMCSGAIIQARINHLYFAAYDPKGGGITSSAKTFDIQNINHRPNWTGGILEPQASEYLSTFFKQLRKK